MKLTWIDLNSWIIKISNQTILLDPWLVDPLVFSGQPWLFTAYHQKPPAFTPSSLPPLNCLLISQGVDDHCHLPTLAQLDRDIPAIASPTAAKRVKTLGYKTVIALSHWQEYRLNDTLKIIALPGATIQPGQEENGYLLQDLTTGKTLYYEPHLSPLTKIKEKVARVDVAIAPIIGQIFPFLGQLIMGSKEALNLVETLKPKYFLPTTLGEIRASGILPQLIRPVGSIAEFREGLKHSGLSTEFFTPQPGETVELKL